MGSSDECIKTKPSASITGSDTHAGKVGVWSADCLTAYNVKCKPVLKMGKWAWNYKASLSF